MALGSLAILSIATQAQAVPVLHIHDPSNTLGTVDVANGDVTIIGTMNTLNGELMTDIAFDPNGNLFGVSFFNLYSIDKTTAQVTLIGAHGIGGGNALVFGTDGTLYSAGADAASIRLFILNPATGAQLDSFETGFRSAGDLAFNSGRFFLAARIVGPNNEAQNDELVEFFLGTETAESRGSFGFDFVFGLATGDNGILYGVSGTNVFKVNIDTGAGFDPVDYAADGGDPDVMAAANGTSFLGEAKPTGVPEPASFGLLGAGLAGLGFASRRTKSRA
jgi:hypothetical protein